MSKAVIIFDAKGHIWAVNYGEMNVPQGIKAMLVDIPENVQSIDGIDVEHGNAPIYSYIPQAQMDRFDQLTTDFMSRLTDGMDRFMKTASVFAENLNDEQAYKVPDLYPEWSGNGVSYKAGTRVLYKNVLWRVISDHRSQDNWTPEFAPSLFAKILMPDDGSIPEWEQPSAENAYAKGDIVSHGGFKWRSLVDNNVWQPGVAGTETLWEKIDG